MIKNALLFFALLLTVVSCQTSLNIPKAEECWNSIEQTGKLLCKDDRLPKDERVYTRFLGQKPDGSRVEDVCTNADDYQTLRNELIDVKTKYLICKKHPKKCK